MCIFAATTISTCAKQLMKQPSLLTLILPDWSNSSHDFQHQSGEEMTPSTFSLEM
jgi:hypothetical protein